MTDERLRELVALLNTNAQEVYHLIRKSGNEELRKACRPLLLGQNTDAGCYGIWDAADEIEAELLPDEEDEETEDDEEEDEDDAEAETLALEA